MTNRGGLLLPQPREGSNYHLPQPREGLMAQVRLLSASHTVGVCDSGTRTTAASSLNLRLAGLKDVEWFGEPSTCPATVDEFSDGIPMSKLSGERRLREHNIFLLAPEPLSR